MHQLAMVYDEQQASLSGVLKDALLRHGYGFDEYDDGGVEGIDAGIYFYRPTLPTPMYVPMSQDGALFVSVDVFSMPGCHRLFCRDMPLQGGYLCSCGGWVSFDSIANRCPAFSLFQQTRHSGRRAKPHDDNTT